jgi:hypothetical protein
VAGGGLIGMVLAIYQKSDIVNDLLYPSGF